MKRLRWHILRSDDAVTVSRTWPLRWDVAVETVVPAAARERIAHQVRQDMWRALRSVRGFAPIVKVVRSSDVLRVVAGGCIEGRFDRCKVESQIKAVLEQPQNRARWLRSARKRAQLTHAPNRAQRFLQAEEGAR